MANPFEKPVDPFLKKKWDRVFYTFFGKLISLLVVPSNELVWQT